MSICKASETGDPPTGWGVQAKRGQIAKNEGNAADGRFPTASLQSIPQIPEPWKRFIDAALSSDADFRNP